MSAKHFRFGSSRIGEMAKDILVAPVLNQIVLIVVEERVGRHDTRKDGVHAESSEKMHLYSNPFNQGASRLKCVAQRSVLARGKPCEDKTKRNDAAVSKRNGSRP